MTWAWTLQLPPSPKFVLMALADEADDLGYCFPSHRRLAQKCSITERSVRRLIHLLVQSRYLVVQARFNNRARTSNGYHLAVGHPRTNCPGGQDTSSQAHRPVLSGGDGRMRQGALDSVVRVTTTYPSIDPIQPLPLRLDTTQSALGRALHNTNSHDDLCFPKALSKAQRQGVALQVNKLGRQAAQLVLDELAGRMNITHIHNPVGYCAALVVRSQRGDFTPELGIRVAEERSVERERQTAFRGQACTTGIPTDAASRLPEGIRSSLERMRRGHLGPPLPVTE